MGRVGWRGRQAREMGRWGDREIGRREDAVTRSISILDIFGTDVE